MTESANLSPEIDEDISFVVTIPSFGRPDRQHERLLAEVERHVKLSISKRATVRPHTDWASDVREFHETFGHLIGDKPKLLDPDLQEARYGFLKEEMKELRDAIDAGDLVEQVDALLDICYFAVGELVCLGAPINEAWDEVQRSNMAKRNPDGTVSKHPVTGKVIKPKGWKAPDLAKVLRSAGWRKPRTKAKKTSFTGKASK